MIMMKEGHRMTFNERPDKAAYFQKQSESVIDALVPPIEEAKRRGLVRDFPPTAVAHMIMGNVKGYHMHMCMALCRHQRPVEDASAMPEHDVGPAPDAAAQMSAPGAAPSPAPDAAPGTMPAPEDSARFLSTFLLDGLLSDLDD